MKTPRFKTFRGSPCHTPGPWAKWVGGKSIHAGVNENTRAVIRSSMGEICDFEHSDRPARETRANLLLVCAAPDMMAALERLIAHHASQADPSMDDVLDAARAAVAKAKGGRS